MSIKRLVLMTTMLLGASVSVAHAEGTLDKIAKNGEIVIGHRESSVPFSYLDKAQNPIGYTIDICKKIVEAVSDELGKEITIKYVPVNPKTRIQLIANGTIDLECGSTTNNLTRQQQVEYLPTTFITGTKLLVKKDSGIKSINDLEGKVVALSQGTTNERVIKAEIKKAGMNVKVLPVRDHAEGMLSLETGRVDAYSTDHILLFGLISKAKQPKDFDVVGEFLSYDPYAIMLRRNDSAFELVGKKALASIMRSGEILAIYNKWFDPLGVPAGARLKTAFTLGGLPE